MMVEFNEHSLVPNWAEPPEDQVQEFFDTLEEKYIRDELWLVQDTNQAELDYITARTAEAELAKEAGSRGGRGGEGACPWGGVRWGSQQCRHRGPLIGDDGDEPSGEEAEAAEPPAARSGRVLWRASSGKPVRPGRAVQPRHAQETSVRQTWAAAAKKVVKAAVAKKKAAAPSPSKRSPTPPASPPPAGDDTEVFFDLGSLSPRRKRKAAEEETEDE